MTTRNRLRLALLLIGTVVLIGASGFHYIEHWSWFDGLYMTLITMTTVGYGETHPLSPVGKVFNTFLIITAVTVGGFLIASVTQAMLEFELANFLGRRRVERELAKLTHHYIICGAGRVGRTVVRELRARKIACLIIEKDPARRNGHRTKESRSSSGTAPMKKSSSGPGSITPKGWWRRLPPMPKTSISC